MVKKRGLGRGLDALLSVGIEGNQGEVANADLQEIPVDLLQRGRYQPRVDMHEETLSDLAESIKAQGVVQPIVVRPTNDSCYEIIAGERRWRATQLAGLDRIPAIVKDVPDEVAVAMALIENIQRENLNPLEEASAIKRLIDEFGMTHQEASDAVGRSRTAVSNLLRLLDLSSSVKPYLERGELEMGHARALLSLAPDLQLRAAQLITKRGLSVREAEKLSRSMLPDKSGKSGKQKQTDRDIQRLEDDLAARLAAKVTIRYHSTGKGRLLVDFNSLDELEGILEHIQ